MKSLIIDALDAASDGYSADRVVADPNLNTRFVAECRRRELTIPIAELNGALLNLRKRGLLAGRSRSRRTSFAREEEYRFASEMAARFLERRDNVTLDRIICDPDCAAEFDKLAASIVAGFTSLEYRWAALNLRKAKALKPEILARVAPPIQVATYHVKDLRINDVPALQGLYLFFASNELLYVGEAENLRVRLKKHLDHSDNKEFARWIWGTGTGELRVEIQVLEATTSGRVRKALELELIRSRTPTFNVKR